MFHQTSAFSFSYILNGTRVPLRFFRHSQRGQLFIKTHLSLLNLLTETGPIGSGSGVHLKVYVNFGVSCFSGGVLSKIFTFDNHLLGHFNFKFFTYHYPCLNPCLNSNTNPCPNSYFNLFQIFAQSLVLTLTQTFSQMEISMLESDWLALQDSIPNS